MLVVQNYVICSDKTNFSGKTLIVGYCPLSGNEYLCTLKKVKRV